MESITAGQLRNILCKAYTLLMDSHTLARAQNELTAWIMGYLNVDRTNVITIVLVVLKDCREVLK